MPLAVWAEVKLARHDTSVWAATDVKIKLIPVIQVDDRSQKAAYQVVHELKQCLGADGIQVLSSDGLKAIFYGLMAQGFDFYRILQPHHGKIV